jgi:hypothetical protein
MTEPGRPTPPTDDAIREMLVSRAGRAGQVTFEPSAVAADAIRRADSEPRPVPLMPRLAVAVTSLAAVLVLVVVVALPLGNRPAFAPPTLVPSAVAPATPTGSAPAPAPDASPRVLTPAELGELVRTRATELAGTIVAVSGRLHRDSSIACARGVVCADTVLADSGGGFHIKPVGDIGPGPWDGSGPKDGMFALRMTSNVDGGRPVVEFVGDLAHRDDGTLAVSVADILGGQIQMEGAYAAVDGWLVRDAFHPCASTKQVFIPRYGCPTDDWLTGSAYEPTQPNGSMIGPRDGIYLPTGSYDQWAPDPAPFGPEGLGVEPRRATYLLWLVASSSCGPNADCVDGPAQLQWRIVGRFDPIPNLDTPPSPGPTPTSVDIPPRATLTVGDLVEPSVQPGEYLVRAYLVATPAFPSFCSGTDPTECENDYLTDKPFQPFSSGDTFASTHGPKIGITVQIGAYDRFAPNPGSAPSGAIEPRIGTYLIRRYATPICFGGAQPSEAPCFGGLGLEWEVIARLP